MTGGPWRRNLVFLVSGLVCGSGLACIPASAQTAASPDAGAPGPAKAAAAQIRFTYDNPQIQPGRYTITVSENGSGHFQSEAGSAPPNPPGPPFSPQEREIQISAGMLQMLFTTARQRRFFAFPCESGGGKIAFQGTKTLSYRGPDGQGSCVYNWTKDSEIERLTSDLESIADTLEEGRKLQLEYEHGRLELDTELDELADMAKDGRAKELENIAPILQAIVSDEAILKRAQRKAQMLLDQAKRDSASK